MGDSLLSFEPKSLDGVSRALCVAVASGADVEITLDEMTARQLGRLIEDRHAVRIETVEVDRVPVWTVYLATGLMLWPTITDAARALAGVLQ